MKIELRNISKRFSEKVLFNDFSTAIEHNSITCIFGPSGCGKTTLLNIIGFLEAYKGEVLFDDKKISSNKEIRDFLSNKVSFIFQDFGLIDNEKVTDNMLLVKNAKKRKGWKEDIASSLKEVGLAGFQDRVIYELSGGEQQRVAIAKVIFKNADLILADEPTASLDAENKNAILELFSWLKKEGKTIIIVSHDQELKAFSDYNIEL